MNPIIEDTTINKPAKNLLLSLVDMESLRSERRSKTKKTVEKNDLDKDAMLYLSLSYDERIDLELTSIGLTPDVAFN